MVAFSVVPASCARPKSRFPSEACADAVDTAPVVSVLPPLLVFDRLSRARLTLLIGAPMMNLLHSLSDFREENYYLSPTEVPHTVCKRSC